MTQQKKLTRHGRPARGEVIRVTGRVFDAGCVPVEGAPVFEFDRVVAKA
jgi:protocatechuate 3,4-dioxygenase beta subunit